ncbi:MAG: hypothetical protein RL670_934 [Actinomycetota bacterium]
MTKRAALALGLPVIAAVILLLVGLSTGGYLSQILLLDVGPLVRVGQPIARVVLELSMAATIGTLVLAAWGLPKEHLTKALNLSSVSSAIWVIAGSVSLIFTYVAVSGSSISGESTFGAGLWLFVTQIQLGQYLGINILAAALISLLSLSIRSISATGLLAGLALFALLPMALSGHAAGVSGHSAAVNAMGLHLVAVSAWVGGLIALVLLRAFGVESFDLAKRYSTLALLGFAVVAASGVSSAMIRVQSPDQLLSEYGSLVIAKSAALVILGAAGAWHRKKLLVTGATQTARWSKPFLWLVLAELAVMGAAIGLATALSKTKPPVDQALNPNPSPAQILTGEPLPPEFTPERWLTAWRPDLLWLTIAALAIIGYLIGVVRLHRRGDRWPLGRTIAWLAGMLTLVYITSGAMNVYQEYLFSVHMIAHMALTMAVPVLLVPAAPVTLLLRSSEKRQDGSWGLREWVLWAVETKWARFVSHPLVAAVLFASSLVIFYYTPLIEWSVRDHVGHQWMVVHFLITGYLFVQSLVGVDPGPARVAYPIRLLLLIGTLAFHAFFGLALMTGNGLIMADWYGSMGRQWGETPLQDQQTGGAIAWGIGELPAAALTLIVSIQWARADKREAVRRDRASDRGGNRDLDDYNAMFEQLSKLEERRR